MKPRLVILFAVVVFAVVSAAIWFLQSQPANSMPITTAAAGSGELPPDSAPERAPAPPLPSTARVEQAPAAPPVPQPAWAMRIDQVLGSGANETEMAQMLINLVPTLPPDGQVLAAGHIDTLLVGKEYVRAMPLLLNAALPQDVLDVFYRGLMNRDDPIKLPAMLEVAKLANHPYHEEAMTALQVYLDQDNGSNWTRWDRAVQDYLRKQAAAAAGVNAPPSGALPAPQ